MFNFTKQWGIVVVVTLHQVLWLLYTKDRPWTVAYALAWAFGSSNYCLGAAIIIVSRRAPEKSTSLYFRLKWVGAQIPPWLFLESRKVQEANTPF